MAITDLRQTSIFGRRTPNDSIFGTGMTPLPEDVAATNPLDINAIRQSNIFSGAPIVPTEHIGSPSDEEIPFTPEHEATDRFAKLEGSYPERNKPGILRHIAAMAAGLGGPSPVQDKILHGPFLDKLEDWKNQIGPAEQAANNERYANALGGNMAYRSATVGVNRDKVEETERKNRETETIARDRNAILKWKAENPSHHFEKGRDGKVYAIDPQTNEKTDLNINSMSDWDLLVANQKNALARIDETNEGRIQLKRTPGTANNNDQPGPAKIAFYNAGKQYVRDHPEVKQWLHFDEDGPNTMSLDNPKDDSWFSKGPPQDVYDRINQGIKDLSGRYNLPPQNKVPTGGGDSLTISSRTRGPRGDTPKVMTKTQSKKDANGKVIATRTVYSYDGGKTWGVK